MVRPSRTLALLGWVALGAGCRPPASSQSVINRPVSVGPSPVAQGVALRAAALADASSRASTRAPITVAEATRTLRRSPARSWTDPRALALLEADCAAVHPLELIDHDEEDGETVSERPLDCMTALVEQSCTFDPCSRGERDPCKVQCGTTCESCQSTCRASCQSARGQCTTDECRSLHTRECAGCLNNCMVERDRCATGHCARQYAECTAQTVAEWRRTCLPSCQRCTRACEGRDAQAPNCLDRCMARARNCTEDQREICRWQGPEYGDR